VSRASVTVVLGLVLLVSTGIVLLAAVSPSMASAPPPPTVETQRVLDADQVVEGILFGKGTVLQLVSSDKHWHPPFRYIKQATLSRDQIIQGIPFRKGSVVPFIGGRVTQGILSRDALIQNLPLKANTAIALDYDRTQIRGTLSRSVSLNGVPFAANREIAVDRDLTAGTLARTASLACLAPIQTPAGQNEKKPHGRLLFLGSAPIQVTRDGLVRSGVLAKDQLVREFELPRGTGLHFSNALPAKAELPRTLSARAYKILGVLFKDGSTMNIQFYPQTIVVGLLAGDTTLGGLEFAGGTTLTLHRGTTHQDIDVVSGTLTGDRQVAVDAKNPRAGAIPVMGRKEVKLDYSRFGSGVLSKNLVIHGIEYAQGHSLSVHEPYYCASTICVSSGVLARDQTVGSIRIARGVRVVLDVRGRLESLTPAEPVGTKKSPGTATIQGAKYLIDLDTFIHSTGVVQQGRLAEDAKLDGARLKKGTVLGREASGQFTRLVPEARSAYRQGFYLDGRGASFDANYSFNMAPSTGVIETGVLYRSAVIGTVPLPAGTRLTSLDLKTPALNTAVTLEQPGKIQGLALDKGTRVLFAQSRIDQLTLPRGRTLTIGGVEYKTLYGPGHCERGCPEVPRQPLRLFSSGRMKTGVLARDQQIAGVHCLHDRPVEFDASGNLSAGYSAGRQNVRGRTYNVGERIELR
jgi:hypothetical protein